MTYMHIYIYKCILTARLSFPSRWRGPNQIPGRTCPWSWTRKSQRKLSTDPTGQRPPHESVPPGTGQNHRETRVVWGRSRGYVLVIASDRGTTGHIRQLWPIHFGYTIMREKKLESNPEWLQTFASCSCDRRFFFLGHYGWEWSG